MKAGRARVAGSLVILLLTAAVFGRTLGHGFVSLDDPTYVVNNRQVLDGLSWHGTAWAFTATTAANWHPLTWLSHQLDADLFGSSPGGHHATSVLIHLVTALALFPLVASLTASRAVGFVVAALFAIHPQHVESVAWVAERKDVLSGLFFVLTLAAWLRYCRRPSPRWYGAALVAHGVGLLAKPMLVTTPLVLILLDWWPLNRPRGWRALREKAPFLLLSAASAVITLYAQSRGNAVAGTDALPVSWRLANGAVSMIAYLRKTLWPSDLAASYLHPGRSLSIPLAAGCALALVALAAAATARRRRSPWLAGGLAWFLVMLLPVSGLVQVGPQALADRYTYLPLIGVFVAAATEARAVLRRSRAAAIAGLLIFAGILGVLAAAASVQAGYWRDSAALYERALSVDPGNWVARLNLAHDQVRRGDLARAVANYREAIAARPQRSDAWYGLCLALEGKGESVAARAACERAVSLGPDDADAQHLLGRLLARGNRPGEAVEHLRRAVASRPESADMQFDLGATLAAAGRPAEAEAAYRAAIGIAPGMAFARNNLGTLLYRQGRFSEAVAQLRVAAEIAPADREIRANLISAEGALHAVSR